MYGIDTAILLDEPQMQTASRPWRLDARINATEFPDCRSFVEANSDARYALILTHIAFPFAGSSLPVISRHIKRLKKRPYVLAIADHYVPELRSAAFQHGADWVLEADGSNRLQSAHLEAIVRRCSMLPENLRLYPPYRLNLENRNVIFGSKRRHLTRLDFHLASYLFANPERLLSRDRLLQEIWNCPPLHTKRRVDTKVSHLRKSLELDGRHGWEIRASRDGIGYTMKCDDQFLPRPFNNQTLPSF